MSYCPDVYDNNIILTRVRLARNVRGEPFSVKNKRKADAIVKTVFSAASRAERFNLFYLAPMSKVKREALKERHLVSKNLIENSEFSAVLLNAAGNVSVMIHEEDVLREQCFMRGLGISEAYKRLDRLDDELQKNVDFAFDKKLGYLTACPTNVGTGMRASVMMFLPALTESGKIAEIIKEVGRLGLTVRGAYGEGSGAEGFTYQISNEVTLGVSEAQIVAEVEEAVLRVCEAERITMQSYYSQNLLTTENKCRRALGVLENSVLLGYDEFLEYISQVRLGVSLGFFEFENPEAIDDLIITARPANLCERYEKEMSATERDYYRADFVKNSIKKIRGNDL